MDKIKELAIQTVSSTLGIEISEEEFNYLEKYWSGWLFNMGKYNNLNDIVKDTILENRK